MILEPVLVPRGADATNVVIFDVFEQFRLGHLINVNGTTGRLS
jgi:hypothetical protein